MRIAVLRFGSLWSVRAAGVGGRPLARAAYFNTSGVAVGGRLRRRWRAAGEVRFNAATTGFDPHHPGRAVGRVFDCEGPHEWRGRIRLLFAGAAPRGAAPDLYLVAVGDADAGALDTALRWHDGAGRLVAFSQAGARQEALLLLPAHGWVRGSLGSLVVTPEPGDPARARLLLR